MNPNQSHLNPPFSHIYAEKTVLSHPLATQIISCFPKAKVIPIDHYKDLFNRSHQDSGVQKQSQKLILAEKHGTLIYPGAPVCQSFGEEHFYYTSCVMNCLFDCEYCYLKGMYPSGNLVIFLNLNDVFREAEALLQKHPVYLCVSYDTDLPALESVTEGAAAFPASYFGSSEASVSGIIPKSTQFQNDPNPTSRGSGIQSKPEHLASKENKLHPNMTSDSTQPLTGGYVTAWENFTAAHPDLTIEIRTKAAPEGFFKNRIPHKNVIYAFTLSPQSVIERYEHGTASLNARLQAIKTAQENGFPVRLCFDPMLHVKNYEEVYREMWEQVFTTVDPNKIRDISIGTFRISASYLKQMRRILPNSAPCQFPFETKEGYCGYPKDIETRMISLAEECISRYTNASLFRIDL